MSSHVVWMNYLCFTTCSPLGKPLSVIFSLPPFSLGHLTWYICYSMSTVVILTPVDERERNGVIERDHFAQKMFCNLSRLFRGVFFYIDSPLPVSSVCFSHPHRCLLDIKVKRWIKGLKKNKLYNSFTTFVVVWPLKYLYTFMIHSSLQRHDKWNRNELS